MPIVDFAQDPAESFGTGNFRDDKGRVMYLHDPETAAQFNKTMPGAQVGSAAVTQGPPNESSVATPGGAGAQLVGNLDAVTAPGAAPAASGPSGTPAAPSLPAAAAPVAPEAPAAAPLPAVAPAGPPGAAAPVPGASPDAAPVGGAGAALVAGVNAYDTQVAKRSQPQPPTAPPKPNPPGSLPLHSVHSGENLSVDQGRPLENVLEQAGDEDTAWRTTESLYRQQGRDKDLAVQRGLRAEMAGQATTYGQSTDSVFRASAERRKAEDEQAKIQAEIKRNDESVDPDRYVKNMSTGKRIAMILLAALNGGFGSLIGQKNNGVIDALNAQIDKDFETQKLQAASRRSSLNNDYKRYLDMGLDAKQAEALWRDRAFQALNGFKALEAKRINAKGENERAAEVFLAPLRQAAVQRRGEVLAQAEDKVKRTREEGITHEVPPPQLLTPQDMLAMLGVKKERIEQVNAAQIGDVLGHEVSPEEAQRLKQDAQEFALKGATNQSTRGTIAEAAKRVGLSKGKNGWVGNADPGVRPLGISGFDSHAREVDRLFSALKEAKIMGAAREPANTLQREFGDAIERPFQDSDLPQYFNDLDALVDRADNNLRKGYGEAATLYDRTPTGGGRPTSGSRSAAPATPGKPGKSTPAQAAAEKERQRTQQMLEAPGGGDLRSE